MKNDTAIITRSRSKQTRLFFCPHGSPPRPLNILIACEESQTVCKAMRERGHRAYSCDLLPCSGGHPEWHYQNRIEEIIAYNWPWDMILAFPPCTDLATSGAHLFKQKIADGRQKKAIDFFLWLTSIDCPCMAIENPVGVMSTYYRKPSQIIQPYQFGHDAKKTTCLWLKGLPRLMPTKLIAPRIVGGKKRWANQTDSGQNRLPPAPDRAKTRSKTYSGIAEAMALQWTQPLGFIQAATFQTCAFTYRTKNAYE